MVHLSNTLEMFLVVVDIVIICKYSIIIFYKHGLFQSKFTLVEQAHLFLFLN